jgi:hypothetical protein
MARVFLKNKGTKANKQDDWAFVLKKMNKSSIEINKLLTT